MNIIIMRHGDAEMNAASDAQRNLTERGHKQAEAAGVCLQALQFKPDLVWISPYTRARQTAAKVLQSLPATEQLFQELLTPENNPATVLDNIARLNVDNLLLVSHQPLVSALLGLMVHGRAIAGPAMATASLAMVTGEDILPACCELVWLRHAPEFGISH